MNKRILVVEDTPDLLRNLGEFLTMEGFTVVPSLNAKAAMECLEKGERPDLIVTDLSMPEMDGFELIEKIRGIGEFANTPIVIFSARPIHENQARATALGVVRYIKKPCSPEELVLSIQTILKDK